MEKLLCPTSLWCELKQREIGDHTGVLGGGPGWKGSKCCQMFIITISELAEVRGAEVSSKKAISCYFYSKQNSGLRFEPFDMRKVRFFFCSCNQVLV